MQAFILSFSAICEHFSSSESIWKQVLVTQLFVMCIEHSLVF